MNALLTTKLCVPPARPYLVPRLHLAQRPNEGLYPGRKLTLVSASAGYGKTTLVTEWLQDIHAKSSWLSLDEGENDPMRFLAYLLASLERSIALSMLTPSSMRLRQRIGSAALRSSSRPGMRFSNGAS